MNTISSISGTTYSSKTSKTSSKNRWKMSDSIKDKITQLAQEDAKNNEYMGNDYHALVRTEVSKVSPDRNAAIAKATAMMNSDQYTQSGTKLNEEDDFWDKWLSKLLGLPYEAEFETSSSGTYAHLYDENGDEFASFTPGVGWHTLSTKEEIRVHDTMKFTYYDVYIEARQAIKVGDTVQNSDSSEDGNSNINSNNKAGIDVKA